MAWTTIPAADMDPESPLTTSLINALYDNVAAAMNQDSGAPVPAANFISSSSQLATDVVTSSEIAANAVGQSEIVGGGVHRAQLNTSAGTVSAAYPGSPDLTLPGGEYGFYPQLRHSNPAYSVAANIAAAVTGSVFTTNIQLIPSATGTAYAQQRYINSSPPYDLGDGEIPLFIFALIANSGDIEAVYVAPSAPWHYNGPTNIDADYYTKAGQPYKLIKSIIADKMINRDMSARQAILDTPIIELEDDFLVSIPLTQAVKNADIELLPHPFGRASGTVVLLDPVNDEIHRLLELHMQGENICELLHENNFIIGNSPLNRSSPPGVMPVSFRWAIAP